MVIEKYFTFALPKQAGIAQLVEHDLAKVGVAGSSPVSRSKVKVPIPKNGVGIFNETSFVKLSSLKENARVVELVDTLDLKSNDHCGRAGSSPASGT